MEKDKIIATGKDVTVIVSREVFPGMEKEYVEWVRNLVSAASEAPGNLGVTTLMPQKGKTGLYHVLVRFKDQKSVDNWESSEVRQSLTSEANKFSRSHRQVATGLETWFIIPDYPQVGDWRGLQGGMNLGFMFLPVYRGWVVIFSLVVCIATWFLIEKTRLGAYLRAATENPTLVRAFGINVPRMITLTYGFGVALAALAGVMAAPIYNVSPQMGANLIIVVFAVVVIGGMGSIMGAIVTGFGLGIIEGLTKVFFPEASNTVIFIIMAIVLLIRPAGLFGRTA